MNVNIVLFDDFDTLDAFGPAQIFGTEPKHFHLNYLSVNGGIINSSQGVKVWTELLIPQEVEDILLFPGGRGAKRLLCMEEKALEVIKESVGEASICMMVRNGFALVAQTGHLYHRRIAEYEGDENWKRMFAAGKEKIFCSFVYKSSDSSGPNQKNVAGFTKQIGMFKHKRWAQKNKGWAKMGENH